MASAVRYMGTKRSLAPTIARLISATHPDATVVNAFAGTCAVGTALAPLHRVVANDALEFATTVARALLVSPGPVPAPGVASEELRPHFRRNWSELASLIGDRMGREQAALSAAARPKGWRELLEFTEKELAVLAPRSLRSGTHDAALQPDSASLCCYARFSEYFASAYFGVRHPGSGASVFERTGRVPTMLGTAQQRSHSSGRRSSARLELQGVVMITPRFPRGRSTVTQGEPLMAAAYFSAASSGVM